MELSLTNHFLPEKLLEHFKIVIVKEIGEISTKKMTLEIHLEELNHLPYGYNNSEYESKGFSSQSRIQDFPIRGKAVYLLIKRRKWCHKETKKEIRSRLFIYSRGFKNNKGTFGFFKRSR